MHEDERQKQFVTLYVRAEPSVRQLLRVLVHDHRMYEDVCQAVALRLWELFDGYDCARPFQAWARGVAANVVLEMRRAENHVGLPMPPEAVAAIVDGFERSLLGSVDLVELLEALEGCLETLPRHSRELITLRYKQSLPVGEVARLTNKTLQSTYKVLQRIGQQLAGCIEQRVAAT